MRVADLAARAPRPTLLPCLLTLALLTISVGCGEGSASPDDDESTTASEGSETPTDPEPEPDPGPRPTLRISGEPARLEREVAIRIENRGEILAELETAIGLQRQDGDEWEDVSATMHVRETCAASVPEGCVSLAPGGVLLPPAWSGMSGDGQCECARCAAVEAGTYRFVLQTCGGGHTLEGEPFQLGD